MESGTLKNCFNGCPRSKDWLSDVSDLFRELGINVRSQCLSVIAYSLTNCQYGKKCEIIGGRLFTKGHGRCSHFSICVKIE